MYSKREDEVKAYMKQVEERRQIKISEAREAGSLIECQCCYSDECLEEDMLPCMGGHMYCKECVQRGSEVAIGEGKTQMKCLGQCDQDFELATLQKALKPNVFSKWLKKI